MPSSPASTEGQGVFDSGQLPAADLLDQAARLLHDLPVSNPDSVNLTEAVTRLMADLGDDD